MSLLDGDGMTKKDERDPLSEEVFTYQSTRDGTVFISWKGRRVTTLQGQAARSFLARVSGTEPRAAQLVMAKVTGNFKRGNER